MTLNERGCHSVTFYPPPCSGTDCDELVFVDLKSRRLVLRLQLHERPMPDLAVIDVVVLINDAQSQTTLLITQEVRRRGSGDAGVTPIRVGFADCHTSDFNPSSQPPHVQPHAQPRRFRVQQSRLVLEKRMENNMTTFPPLNPNFADDYVFQVLILRR